MTNLTKFLDESKAIERDARCELAEITCSMSIPNALDDLAKLRRMVEFAVESLKGECWCNRPETICDACRAVAELERLAKWEK